MKFSQKVVNAIIVALLALFGYNEYDPILPQAHEVPQEMSYTKKAPTIPAPQVVPQVTDEPIFVEGESEPKTSWYCWLSYWVPTYEECADFAPDNCQYYSWYAHPNRIRIVQEKKPTEEDFYFENELYLPPQLQTVPGIDTKNIQLAHIYTVKAWPRNPEE